MRNKANWDLVAKFYDKFITKDKKMYQELANKMLKNIERNHGILEVGTGTGMISILLAPYVDKINAIDFSEKMIEKAKENSIDKKISNISFNTGDVYKLLYPDNYFDRIIIANVLHIIPNPQEAIKELKRVIKPSGIIFAPTFLHKRNFLANTFEKLANLIFGFKAYSKWSEESFQEFLKAEDLRIIESKLINGSFPLCYIECQKG
ncbi:MAG: methyltransferase domain-containing protein [Fusobacteriaceae bacterium]|nr:methyltransferase domain-containing protein [Fusobacteriaceae bacterium]